MYYAMIFGSALLCALQFLFYQKYQEESGSSWDAAINGSFYQGITVFVLFALINLFTKGFILNFSPYACFIGFIVSLICIACSYSSVKALETANLSVYSMFTLLGPLLIPTVFGVLFLNEGFTLTKAICCALIIVAVVMTVEKDEKRGFGPVGFYVVVFATNGLVSVVYKLQQIDPRGVDSVSIIMIAMLWNVVLNGIIKLIKKPISFNIKKKSLAYISVYGAMNGIGNLLCLVALMYIPASVQYPVLTGGGIILSTVIAAVRGEKISKKTVASVIISFAAVTVMASDLWLPFITKLFS